MTAKNDNGGPEIPPKITREELYEMVWAEPVSRLANKLGVSDVAVAKWCRKLGVPRPGRGYWARIEAGQSVKRTPLPKATKNQTKCVYPPRGGRTVPSTPPKDDVPGIEAFTLPIEVPDRVDQEHQLVASLRTALERVRVDDTGPLKPRARKLLDVSVSEAQRERALRIINALVNAIEAAGHSIKIVTDKDGEGSAIAYRTIAVIDDEPIQFSFHEKVEKTQREPTAAERRKMERDYFFRGPFYEVTATGKLSLKVESHSYGDSFRRTWSDGKRQRVENCLWGFIRSLLLSAHSIKRRRRETEERRIREEQERILREERQRQEQEELKGRLALENAAFAWEHAEGLRSFLAAVGEAVSSDPSSTPDVEAAFTEWLEWARWYVDHLDPLLPTEGVAERMTTIPDDHFPSSGYRDSMEQIRRHVQSIASDLSSLQGRFRYVGYS